VDVTDDAYLYLNDNVKFEEGVTLRTLFSLIHKHIDIFKLIFGNWIDEYTDVILNGVPEKEDDEGSIDYLRVYFFIEVDDKGNELSIPAWPDFDGIGVAKTDDVVYKKGDTIKWGVGYSPMQNLADLPIILQEKVEVWYSKSKELKEYESNGFTLYQVIQGIVWEISFHGGPEQTSKFMDKIQVQIERIKSGEEKTYPLEDLLGGLDSESEALEIPLEYEDGFRHHKKLFE